MQITKNWEKIDMTMNINVQENVLVKIWFHSGYMYHGPM